jgi:hypothetical protein
MVATRRAVGLGFAVLFAVACATPTVVPIIEKLCEPNEEAACLCPGGEASIRVCEEDGLAFSACRCAPTGVGGAGGVGGIGGAGGSAGMGGVGGSAGMGGGGGAGMGGGGMGGGGN